MTRQDFEQALSRALAGTVFVEKIGPTPTSTPGISDALATDCWHGHYQREYAITKPIAYIGFYDLRDLMARERVDVDQTRPPGDGFVFMGVPLFVVRDGRWLQFAQDPRA